MKLYEFEGHKILSKAGISSPFFVVCSDFQEVEQARKRLKFPMVAKVQVLAGKRGKNGGVKICANEKALKTFSDQFLGKDFLGEKIRFITVCQKVDIEHEYYVSITYDTVSKQPVFVFSDEGGMDIEEVKKQDPGKITSVTINPVIGPAKKDFLKIPLDFDFVLLLWDAFYRYDCRLVEINPIAKTAEGELVAIDAKVILDDNGQVRHKDLDVAPKGAASAIPTKRELEARQIDAEDYRGSAGSTFIELDGDIAILASGGGASLLVMDSLIAAGASPANYTEYSGNPPRDKVAKLTKLTLEKEGLTGCLVAGAVANFTDIYETLLGFADGLKQVVPKPTFPIVVRRGGPRQEEAYEMLRALAKREGFDIHLFSPETPISVACAKMAELSEQYKRLKMKDKK